MIEPFEHIINGLTVRKLARVNTDKCSDGGLGVSIVFSFEMKRILRPSPKKYSGEGCLYQSYKRVEDAVFAWIAYAV